MEEAHAKSNKNAYTIKYTRTVQAAAKGKNQHHPCDSKSEEATLQELNPDCSTVKTDEQHIFFRNFRR